MNTDSPTPSNSETLPEEKPQIFGELFKGHLDGDKQGRSLSEIAGAAGVSKGYLSLLARGEREKPSRLVVERLGQVLALSAEEIDRLIEAAGCADDSALKPGRRPGFKSLSGTSKDMPPSTSMNPLWVSIKGKRPLVEVYCHERGSIELVVRLVDADVGSEEVDGQFYLRVSAEGGQNFPWLEIESNKPPRVLPIQAKSARIYLAVGEGLTKEPRMLDVLPLGPQVFQNPC